MTDIVHDYAAIAKAANLRALDGRPQNEVKAVEAPQPDWSHMCGYGVDGVLLYDTAPAEYCAPDEDCA